MIRRAAVEDVPAMAQVEASSWPAALATSEETLLTRIRAFPEGQLVAELNGGIVGVAAAQRISSHRLASVDGREPGSADSDLLVSPYDRLTDAGRFTRSHDARGDVFQLIGVGVTPAGRGHRLGRVLVDREIALGRSLPGVSRIVGFTRPAHFHRHAELDIANYLSLCDPSGAPLDPVLAFHLQAGATIVSTHAGFRPADVESRGYGVLIEYPL